MSRVKRVPVPDHLRELTELNRVDYQDAFGLRTSTQLTPEQWMRLFLEGAPSWFIRPWVGALTAVGARFAPHGARDQVLGWEIRHNSSQAIVVGLDVAIGLTARLIALTPPGHTVVGTQLRLDTAIARALWVVIGPGHRAAVEYLLDRAATRPVGRPRQAGDNPSAQIR